MHGIRSGHQSRREVLRHGALAAAAFALTRPTFLRAEGLPVLDVASAGSIRAMLDGPLKEAVAQDLHLDLRSHSSGADTMARALVDGSQPADVFIPITESPMRTVMAAGKAHSAYPVARTEFVLLYSARSRFAPRFAAAAQGKEKWWQVLQTPGLKLARNNPANDPSGRAILFAIMLAARKYGQPDLVQKVLGAPLNPAQVQPGTNVRAGLEDGTIDAAGSYKIATGPGKLPYMALPADVNLSELDIQTRHAGISLTLGDKIFYPEPLIFYAAALTSAANPQAALQFVSWLRGKQAATLLQASGFNLPNGANTISNA